MHIPYRNRELKAELQKNYFRDTENDHWVSKNNLKQASCDRLEKLIISHSSIKRCSRIRRFYHGSKCGSPIQC
jgi:hypothetical protein